MPTSFSEAIRELANEAAPERVQAALYKTAIALRLPVAVWRLPSNENFQLCISLSKAKTNWKPQLEEHAPGFAFCPFEQTEKAPSLFISADVYYNSSGNWEFAYKPEEEDNFGAIFIKAFTDELVEENLSGWHLPKTGEKFTTTENAYKETVAKAIEAIKTGELEKVVPSRFKTLQLPAGFDPVAAFRKLEKSYDHAFVSLVAVPGAGTWIGATPEVLVSVSKDKIFETMALAGTQPVSENPKQAVWRQKEIEEQAMVKRYIINCFKKIRLREYEEVGPRTVVAANLMHLRTDFKADMEKLGFPKLGSQMLELLHPTSAVCGMPKEKALEFLKENEGYSRRYYSGYLGPVQINQESRIFVNLRCLELLAHEAVLYAGAGVTAESDPEKEWQETEMKMETLLGKLRVKN